MTPTHAVKHLFCSKNPTKSTLEHADRHSLQVHVLYIWHTWSLPVCFQERKKIWSNLSPGGRGQFSYPDPGLPRVTGDEDVFKKVPRIPSLIIYF